MPQKCRRWFHLIICQEMLEDIILNLCAFVYKRKLKWLLPFTPNACVEHVYFLGCRVQQTRNCEGQGLGRMVGRGTTKSTGKVKIVARETKQRRVAHSFGYSEQVKKLQVGQRAFIGRGLLPTPTIISKLGSEFTNFGLEPSFGRGNIFLKFVEPQTGKF